MPYCKCIKNCTYNKVPVEFGVIYKYDLIEIEKGEISVTINEICGYIFFIKHELFIETFKDITKEEYDKYLISKRFDL